MPFLEARAVSKHFPGGPTGSVRALDAVSLAVERGDFLALTGPSGSGKSTLLTLLGALDRPTGGEVRFDGRSLERSSGIELARLRRRMGFIFQDYGLIAGLPAWENVTYPLIPRGVSSRARRDLARALLDRLGVADKFAARPEQLSGGEQQRVAVARALAGEPEVLFADEPTSSLDSATAAALLDALLEFHGRGGTMVVSTHDPQVVARATAVRELRAGRLA